MHRRTRRVLLVGSLSVATVVGLWVVLSLALAATLSAAFTRGVTHNRCEIGLRNLIIGCHFTWSRTITTTPSRPPTDTSSSAPVTFAVDDMSWDITNHCPLGDIAKRLLCPGAPAAAPAGDDLKVEPSQLTGLPLPKGRVVTTEENSPSIKSVHVETPLDLAVVLGFYRDALSKRGWTENAGAVVAPDRAVIAFTTADGPALLRLIREDHRTIADLSLRKPAAANAATLPKPGQVRLMLGNATDQDAVVTINAQTVRLAAKARLRAGPTIDLPPGKFKVTLEVASDAAQNREFEVAADETWGLLVGPAGVPLPVRVY